MTNHPITPPPELVQQWDSEAVAAKMPGQLYLATEAARWGSDQELEACCQVLYARYDIPNCIDPRMAEDMREWLRAARRPKPPSLKEQALRILVENGTTLDGRIELEPEDIPIIRRALEQLDD